MAAIPVVTFRMVALSSPSFSFLANSFAKTHALIRKEMATKNRNSEVISEMGC